MVPVRCGMGASFLRQPLLPSRQPHARLCLARVWAWAASITCKTQRSGGVPHHRIPFQAASGSADQLITHGRPQLTACLPAWLGCLQGFMQPGNVQEDLFYHLTRSLQEVNRRWGDPLREHLRFLPVRDWLKGWVGRRLCGAALMLAGRPAWESIRFPASKGKGCQWEWMGRHVLQVGRGHGTGVSHWERVHAGLQLFLLINKWGVLYLRSGLEIRSLV
jgi:hypothetical protein